MNPNQDVLSGYPLPLARAYLKLWNAAPAEKHRVGYEWFESLARYLAALTVAQCLDRRLADDALRRRAQKLRKPSAGDWIALVDLALGVLKGADAVGPLAEVETLWKTKQKSLPALTALVVEIERAIGSEKPSGQPAFALGQAAQTVVQYRNQKLGHGASETSPASAIEVGKRFEEAATEILRACQFLATHRLLYVEDARRPAPGQIVHSVLALSGLCAWRADDVVTAESGALLPGRVYLRRAGASDAQAGPDRLVSLHPFLRFEPEDLDVYYLNGLGDGERGKVDYLSYWTGGVVRRTEVFDELREVLGVARGDGASAPATDAPAGDGAQPVVEDEKPADSTDAAQGAVPAGRMFDRYLIVGKLGAGAFGIVYEAHDTRLRRRVALKIAKQEVAGTLDARTIERFKREAALAAELDHEYIVKVYDAGEFLGQPFYAAEYIDGGTLRTWIAQRRAAGRPLSSDEIRQVLRWGEMAATALHAAHTHHRPGESTPTPIVHRDVSPDNLMIAGDGTVRMIDFGLAQDLSNGARMTMAGEVLGAPVYASPEQTVDAGLVHASSDIYSLGLTLYAALTLREPYDGGDVVSVLRQRVTGDPPPPRQVAPRIPREVEGIILKATERRPSDRYASAAAFAEDLRRYLADEPTLAKPAGPILRLRKAIRRHRAVAIGAGAALVALLVGAGVVAYDRHRARAEDREKAERLVAGAEGLLPEAIALYESAVPEVWERRAAELSGGELRTYFLSPPPGQDVIRAKAWSERLHRREDATRAAGAIEQQIVGKLAEARALYVSSSDRDLAGRAEGKSLLVRGRLALARRDRRARDLLEDASARLPAGEPGLASTVAAADPRARLRVSVHGAWRDVASPADVAAAVARYHDKDTMFLDVEREGRRAIVRATVREGVDGRPVLDAPDVPVAAVRRVSGAVLSLHPVDPSTLETSNAPLPGHAAEPLPLDARDLEPGEYSVVVVDPGEASPTCSPRVQFPVLLAAWDDWTTSIPIALADVPKDFCYVPEGPFLLGSGLGNANERPVRWIPSVPAYFVCVHEVRVREFQAFAERATPPYKTVAERRGKGAVWQRGVYGWKVLPATIHDPAPPYPVPADFAEHPVSQVSIGDAIEYCSATGTRLPTEIQWEKAARGIDGRTFPWGEEPAQNDVIRAMFDPDSKDLSPESKFDKYAATAPVGHFPRGMSPYGAHDMAGNVFEFCRNRNEPEAYKREDPATPDTNPDAPDDVPCCRGGSWGGVPPFLRSALRGGMDWNRAGSPQNAPRDFANETPSCSNGGFRVVKDVRPAPASGASPAAGTGSPQTPR